MLSKLDTILICLITFTMLFIYFYSEHESEIESFTSNELKIYFINMDQNIDRWNKIKNSLPNLVRFKGINGKELVPDELIKKGLIQDKNDLLPGQLGCAMSHLGVMNKIKDQSEEYALILENDVIIPENFQEIIEDLKKYFPDNWDIIFLGGCNIVGKKHNEKMIKPTDISGTKNLCMHAVLVHKKNVQKVIDVLTPLYRPIDSQLRDHYNELEVFYANPNIINQNKELISNRRVLDGLPQSAYWKAHHMDITLESFGNQYLDIETENYKYL